MTYEDAIMKAMERLTEKHPEWSGAFLALQLTALTLMDLDE
jgi:trehalose-6-phosphate synthase